MKIRLSDLKLGHIPVQTEDERQQLLRSLPIILEWLSAFLPREQGPLNRHVRQLLSRCGIQIRMDE